MTEWRFSQTAFDSLYDEYATVKDLWPDVKKTVIYQELLDWGIDAEKIPVKPGNVIGMSATPYKLGVVGVGQDLRDSYPKDEDTYVGLVHELAHLLQSVQGIQSLEGPRPTSARSWIEDPLERDAIRWSAKQAIRMGWNEEQFDRFLDTRYMDARAHGASLLSSLKVAGLREFSPKTAGVVPMFRRPPGVRVRGHRRRA